MPTLPSWKRASRWGIVVSLLLLLLLSAQRGWADIIPVVQITASSIPEPQNRPYNTLSILDGTRWSAKSTKKSPTQWIQYQFAEPWVLFMVTLDWWQSDRRQLRFQVQTSPDCTAAYTTVLDTVSLFKMGGPQAYAVSTSMAQCVRIVGFGAPPSGWNSLQSAQFEGFLDRLIPPEHFWLDVIPQENTLFQGEEWEPLSVISDGQPDTSMPMNAGSSLDITLVPYNTVPGGTLPDGSLPATVYTRCVALWFAEPSTSFHLSLRQGDQDVPLIEATAPIAAFLVYPIDPAVLQMPYTDSYRLLVNTDAHLKEALFLHECRMPTGQQYASSAEASTFEDVSSSYRPPTDTLDTKLDTRWSALGDGVMIEYQLLEGTQSGIGLTFFRGEERSAAFDIVGSVDGILWFPIRTDVHSTIGPGQEWFSFPPVWTSYLRIIGHGNTENQWTSILDATFGTPQP